MGQNCGKNDGWFLQGRKGAGVREMMRRWRATLTARPLSPVGAEGESPKMLRGVRRSCCAALARGARREAGTRESRGKNAWANDPKDQRPEAQRGWEWSENVAPRGVLAGLGRVRCSPRRSVPGLAVPVVSPAPAARRVPKDADSREKRWSASIPRGIGNRTAVLSRPDSLLTMML
jgi:hypothetical protein